MISPSYSITATERVLPNLALDFTTALLDPRITFTRSGDTATVINSSGVIVAVNADIPRFDFDPVTLSCRGLLIEEPRTNVLLNSLIDGTSLATQSVTVTAAARTLTFYGSGQIVLSGTHSATVTGVGAYPTRTTYTFTPTAGTLTLTVTGTVQFAQLELGSAATSFIPTAASQVTRTADLATMTGTNFSDWYNQSEGAFVVEYQSSSIYSSVLEATDTAAAYDPRIFIANNSLTSILGFIRITGSTQMSVSKTITASTYITGTIGYKTNSCAVTAGGLTVSTDNSVTLPTTLNILQFGKAGAATTSMLNGTLKNVYYFPQRLTNAELQAFTK